MQTVSLKRNGKEDLVFTGELLVSLDDRELMGVTPNWWELKLYKTSIGKFILSSTFHINYPSRRTLHGALSFSKAEHLQHYLVNECNGPTKIADEFINRAAKRDQAFQAILNNQKGGSAFKQPASRPVASKAF
ncbi:hypothetical protein [Halodesulfovibrio marinisediminis]|uniref:Uncharacterized protein n=1 Tax=Halodesulfovibrio marinisediminis DSM 17456 TaxID=1121457 RepID=A0A1N6FW93_9BACT|nr:hypothetical protein [Halodesulfovibrio marinisediminis]SIN99487.1 hypothetical protein SAMN02745161_1546 [Halodesulfovibrio marinisediminis DSM 17456]